jgi:hypothetical protein
VYPDLLIFARQNTQSFTLLYEVTKGLQEEIVMNYIQRQRNTGYVKGLLIS